MNKNQTPIIPHTSPLKLKKSLSNFLKSSKTSPLPPLIAIIGPTASGKTNLSVEIAKWIDGEVVSMDSRQVYKEMNIGTAKVTVEEMDGVPHHMIDVADPAEDFTLAHYKKQALEVIKGIHKKGKFPLLVGGTGLYYSAIVENFQVPKVPADNKLRNELEELARKDGVEAVHAILEKENLKAAKKIHPNNLRYVIRAIEIARAKGSGAKRVDAKKGKALFNVFTIAIDWPRDVLYERINKRVGILVKEGLLEEVQGLLDRGLSRENSVAMASHGYQEVIPYLKGEKELDECLDEVRKNTRHYAKRQYTWFRRYPDINWIEGNRIKEFIDAIN